VRLRVLDGVNEELGQLRDGLAVHDLPRSKSAISSGFTG
jgi:hypothetical protein